MLQEIKTRDFPKQKSVLITGASKGIGEACAVYFAKQGWRVFAGYRSKRDGYRIKQLGGKNLDVVKLDVTKEDQIKEAARLIEEQVGGKGLDGLVNNAGSAVGGILEYIPLDDLRWQLELNVIGQVAVTQAFLPLLRKAKGRIVNMSSISGIFSSPLVGPYSMSKFALEAFTDSLRRELMPWEIDVISVQPGSVATEIWETSMRRAEKIKKGLPKKAFKLYGKIIEERLSKPINTKDMMPPQDVVDAVFDALTSEKPKTRYQVGKDTKQIKFLSRFMPDRFFDWMVERTLYK